MSVNVNNDHANTRKEHCRTTVDDISGLVLRGQVDIVTGDWNQAGGYLEECTYHVVKFYETERSLTLGTVSWCILGETCDIRTVFSIGPLTE